MRKMHSLFVREGKPFLATPHVTDEAAWVTTSPPGHVRATVKWDGTCCLFNKHDFYKRRMVRVGDAVPEGWIAWYEMEGMGDTHPMVKSPKIPGWVPVTKEDPMHQAAFLDLPEGPPYGTYELLGPKIQGNPYEGLIDKPTLVLHGMHTADLPLCGLRDLEAYEAVETFLRNFWAEGVVFYHTDGRMAKVKRRDFGIEWPGEERPA